MSRVLHIKQNVLSESFQVADEDGYAHYIVRSKRFSMHHRTLILNAQNQVEAEISRRLRLLPCFDINLQGQQFATVCKKMSLHGKYEVSMANSSLELTGSVWQHTFQVMQGGRELAHISKATFSWGGTYRVTLHEPTKQLELLLVCLVMAIEQTLRARRRRHRTSVAHNQVNMNQMILNQMAQTQMMNQMAQTQLMNQQIINQAMSFQNN